MIIPVPLARHLNLRVFMTTTQAASAATPKFDNHGQYSRTSILRYEMIFGEHYISTGGAATTDDLCSRLGSSLRPGVRVLDVGSGIGGAAFHLVKTYGAKVTGIDLAEEMVNIGLERTAQLGMSDSVKFLLGDVLETSSPSRLTSSGAATRSCTSPTSRSCSPGSISFWPRAAGS